jgi:hypothetical protein
MNILLFFIPLFWTGVPIPHPDCVELVDANTVIIHAEPTMTECDDFMEFYENEQYYIGLGYNKTDGGLHVTDDLKEQGAIKMEKLK